MTCAAGFIIITNFTSHPYYFLRDSWLGKAAFPSCRGSCQQGSHRSSHGRPPGVGSPGRPPEPSSATDRGQDTAPPRSPQNRPPRSSQDPLHTHPRNEKRGETEGGRGGERCCTPPPWTPLQLPVSKSDIYWEINTPWGSSFKPPRKHNGGGAAVAWARGQRPPTFLGDKMGFHGSKSPAHWCR